MPERSLSERELVKPGRQSRLPSLAAVNRTLKLGQLVQRTERSATEVREYNKTITPDHQEQFYIGGMNAIAEKFWHLARNKTSDPQEIRCYADLLLRHFEQKHKARKTAIMERQLALLEEKAKALREAMTDRSLTDAEFYTKIKEICFPVNYGRPTQQVHTAQLLENGNGLAP